MFETVHFNPILVAQVHGTPGAPPIPQEWNPFAITAKAEWLIFKNDDPCVTLPVWSQFNVDKTKTLFFDDWPHRIALVHKTSDSTAACGHLQPVPLSAFYNRPVRSGVPPVLEPASGANATAVLLGLHLASKEVTNWLWITTWWQPPGDPQLSPPWVNYSTDSAISIKNPAVGVRPTLSGKAIFNPYLESRLTFDGKDRTAGVDTDCISCHSGASIGKDGDIHPQLAVGYKDPTFDSLHFIWSAHSFVGE
jgi:hypothetical protein